MEGHGANALHNRPSFHRQCAIREMKVPVWSLMRNASVTASKINLYCLNEEKSNPNLPQALDQ